MSMFEGYFDPCPLNDNWTIDGLDLDWAQHGRIYVNPPYSNPTPWVEKAISEARRAECCIVMLLKHDSSTKWYSKLVEAGARFFMLQGRINFWNPQGQQIKHSTASFPSVLVVLSSVTVPNLDAKLTKEQTLEDYI